MEPLEARALLSAATSSVSWAAGGTTLSAFLAIDQNDNVEVSVGNAGFTNEGGYAKQISAGLTASGKPEVYAIGPDNAVWVNNSSG
jgi:hypothetical protein